MSNAAQPTVDLQRSGERYATRLGWLDSKHSFSFGHHYDPANPIPGGPSNLHSPLWVLLCAGFVFFLAGAALVIQSLSASSATGELPADAPRWLRILQYVIAVAIFCCFGAVKSIRESLP